MFKSTILDSTKCCTCLPLRRLLAVGYSKLAVAIGTLLIVSFFTIYNFLLIFEVFIYIILILGIISDILFVVSVHREKYKGLWIYKRYLIVQLISYLVLFVIYLPWMVLTITPQNGALEYLAGGAGFIITLMALHVFFMYLVRAETRKLQLNTQLFETHVDEPERLTQPLG